MFNYPIVFVLRRFDNYLISWSGSKVKSDDFSFQLIIISLPINNIMQTLTFIEFKKNCGLK